MTKVSWNQFQEDTNDKNNKETKSKKKNKNKKSGGGGGGGSAKTQTDPPSIPVSELFPGGNFPEGQIMEHPIGKKQTCFCQMARMS